MTDTNITDTNKTDANNTTANKTDASLLTYRKFHRNTQILLKISGCYFDPAKYSRARYTWSAFGITIMLSQMFSLWNYVYQNRRNIEILVWGVGLSMTTFANALKVFCFSTHRRTVTEFQRSLDFLFEEEVEQDEDNKVALFSLLSQHNIPAYLYYTINLLMVSNYIPCFLRIIRALLLGRMPTNYGIPYAKFPWAVPDGFLYNFHFLYNAILTWFLNTTVTGVDTAFGFYSYQIRAILFAMSHKLTRNSDEKVSDILRICLKKHKILLRCRECIQSIYGPFVLWHFTTSALVMVAFVLYPPPVSVDTIFDCVLIWTFLVTKFFQSFLYAWYATAITTASENFREAIYSSRWPNEIRERSLRTRMILMLMLKPILLTAMKMCAMSMDIFLNIVNATISYFLLMKTLSA